MPMVRAATLVANTRILFDPMIVSSPGRKCPVALEQCRHNSFPSTSGKDFLIGFCG
jgi:hypothetical protein